MADPLLEANQTFYAAFSSGDIEGMDALWANQAEVSCVHPGWPPLFGRDDVMSSWRSILLGGQAPKVVAERARGIAMGPDAGRVVCLEQLRGQTLVATNDFCLEGGLWLMVHHHAGPLTEWVDPEPGDRTLN